MRKRTVELLGLLLTVASVAAFTPNSAVPSLEKPTHSKAILSEGTAFGCSRGYEGLILAFYDDMFLIQSSRWTVPERIGGHWNTSRGVLHFVFSPNREMMSGQILKLEGRTVLQLGAGALLRQEENMPLCLLSIFQSKTITSSGDAVDGIVHALTTPERQLVTEDIPHGLRFCPVDAVPILQGPGQR